MKIGNHRLQHSPTKALNRALPLGEKGSVQCCYSDGLAHWPLRRRSSVAILRMATSPPRPSRSD